jgi:hypothetical protein
LARCLLFQGKTGTVFGTKISKRLRGPPPLAMCNSRLFPPALVYEAPEGSESDRQMILTQSFTGLPGGSTSIASTQ